MNQGKHILALFSALLISLFQVGCGSSGSSGENPSSPAKKFSGTYTVTEDGKSTTYDIKDAFGFKGGASTTIHFATEALSEEERASFKKTGYYEGDSAIPQFQMYQEYRNPGVATENLYSLRVGVQLGTGVRDVEFENEAIEEHLQVFEVFPGHIRIKSKSSAKVHRGSLGWKVNGEIPFLYDSNAN